MNKQIAVAVLGLAALQAAASAGVTSWTFDSDNQGWQKAGNSNPALSSADWYSAHGLTGGVIAVTSDPYQFGLVKGGLDITVQSASDTLSFDGIVEQLYSWQSVYWWSVIVVTDLNPGGKSYDMPGFQGNASVSNKTITLVGDLGLAVGEKITQITFAGSTNGQITEYIDNVVITTNAVPEPASVCILSVCGLALLAVRQKR